ncbi:MAG TPA: hypothetical protein V6C97_00190 [Oculatellaceae cyanobacterium]
MSNENKEDAAWRRQQEALWSKKQKEKLTQERAHVVAKREDTARRNKEAKEDEAKKKFHQQQFIKQKAWEQRGARDEDRNR